MLKRRFRLRDRRQIKAVYRFGKQATTADITLKLKNTNRRYPRLAVVVSTKISKRAVIRNRLRRRITGACARYLEELTNPADMVIIVRADISQLKPPELDAQIARCLRDLGAHSR